MMYFIFTFLPLRIMNKPVLYCITRRLVRLLRCDGKGAPILGLQACEKLSLIEKMDCPLKQPKQEKPAEMQLLCLLSPHKGRRRFGRIP